MLAVNYCVRVCVGGSGLEQLDISVNNLLLPVSQSKPNNRYRTLALYRYGLPYRNATPKILFKFDAFMTSSDTGTDERAVVNFRHVGEDEKSTAVFYRET